MFYTLFYIVLIVLIITILASLLPFARKGQPVYLKYFSPFLVVGFITEIVAHKNAMEMGNNHGVYNFFSVFAITFYLFIIRHIIRQKRTQRILTVSLLLYPVIAYLNIFFVQGVHTFHSYSHSVGACLIIGFCIAYFNEVFFASGSVTDLYWRPDFWICCGLLFFYLITFTGFAAINLVTHFPKVFLKGMGILLASSGDLLYLAFTVGFLVSYRKPMNKMPGQKAARTENDL